MSDTPQPADGQCAFFLPKKKRFCRFRPNQGQKYCAEHACVLGVELDRKRIVCPLNPKHTCYEDNLEKHLKKCNSRKRRTEDYYEEGINTGTDDGDSVAGAQVAVKATDTDRLKRMTDRVNQLYEEYIGKIDVDVQSHECLQEEMNNPFYGLPALRHRRQQASLIGQLERLGLLRPGHCYVEMGAGKGQLSHWVRKAVCSHDDAAFLLVDRSSIRYKVDGYHKEEETVQFERIKMDIEHLHLGKVPMVANSRRPLVAMGKHLCGAATDLSLRCLMETISRRQTDVSTTEPCVKRPRTEATDKMSDQSESKQGSQERKTSEQTEHGNDSEQRIEPTADGKEVDARCVDDKAMAPADRDVLQVEWDSQTGSGGGKASVNNRVVGVLIALCCHHQCRWRAYVGKKFMRQCGISAADFHLLTRLTSWAVCGWRDRDGSFGTKEDKPGAGKDTKQDSQVSSSNPNMDSQQDCEVHSQSAEHSDASVREEGEHDTEDLLGDTPKTGGLQLTEKEKETVGWKCKRLIDYGRVCYLQDQGLCSNLKIYIDAEQTPENVVLVATPLQTS